MCLARRLAERLGKPGDHLSIDCIILGKSSGRLSEAANPLRVHDPYLNAGIVQYLAPFTLVTTTRLHHRLAYLVLAKPANQSAATLGGIRTGLPQGQCSNAQVYLVLGDVDAHDSEIILCHHPLPSLLGSGLKPLQLFGLRKTPELSLALIQALPPLGRYGLSSSNGLFCDNRPFARSARFPGHKGRCASSRTLGRGCDGRCRCAQDERDESGRRS